MQVYKFSTTATETAPDITADQLVQQMKDGLRYAFGTDNLLNYGIFKIHGWVFNIREELHCYVVKQYDEWHEYWSPNRTALRKLIRGRIDNILEVTK